MKKLFLIILIAVGVISCDDTEPAVFQGDQTLVYFPENTANLDIIVDETGTVDVQINSTTLSDSDREVNLEIVEGDATTVDPQNIEIPSLSVTIPAGEFFGFFTVNGIDVTAETNPELLTVRITDAGGALINESPVEIRVRQICPIAEGLFVGPYNFTQVTPIHPANGGPSFNDQVVDVVQGNGSTERSFDAEWLEFLGIGQGDSTIPFDLSCGEVVITSDEISTNLTCGDGTITLGSAPQRGTYDPEDDSSFTLILSEYLQDGGCGVSPPLVTEFNLTK